MPELLKMPEVAAGSTSAVLSAWQVEINQEYAAGEVIAILETDKAVVDMEAEAPGRIVHFLASGGQEVATGEPLAVRAEVGEEVPDPAAAATALGFANSADVVSPAEASHVEPAASAPAAPTPTSAAEQVNSTDRIFASPIARRLAREAGIALSAIVGTGPGGRIRRRDVDAAQAQVPPAPAITGTSGSSGALAAPTGTPAANGGPAVCREIPHSRLRKAIAARLTESKSIIPHFYLRGTAEVDALLDMRGSMNEGEEVRISVNDFIIKSVAYAHTRVPEMNVVWTQDAIWQYDTVDISVAIATETGLVTPVLRDVGNLSLGRIATATKDFAMRAANNDLRQVELEGGSTSVSNLGMFGTEGFDAIINPPQSTILAVGAARETPVARGGAIEVATTVQFSLSVDHRPIDGATAAKWMQVFIEAVENPARIVR